MIDCVNASTKRRRSSRDLQPLINFIISIVLFALLATTDMMLVVNAQTAPTTRVIPCCPPPPLGQSESSCTIAIDTSANPSETVVAQNCDHTTTTMVLSVQNNNSRFSLLNSNVQSIRLENTILSGFQLTLDSSNLESLDISGVTLLQSNVLVSGTTFNVSTTSTAESVAAVNITSTTLGGNSTLRFTKSKIFAASNAKTFSPLSNTAFMRLASVEATDGSSIVLEDISSSISSRFNNATGILIENSNFYGFMLNASSWVHTAETGSMTPNSGSAGLVAVRSSTTLSGGTRFVLSNVSSSTKSTGISASAYCLKFTNVRAEPSVMDDKSSTAFEVSVSGTISAHCGAINSVGEGAHLVHFNENVVLRNVLIQGVGVPDENGSSSSSSARSSSPSKWAALSISNAKPTSSLFTLNDVDGTNVTLGIQQSTVSVSSVGYAGALGLIENVTITDLTMALEESDVAVTSSQWSSSLVLISATDPSRAELRNPVFRFQGSSSGTDLTGTPPTNTISVKSFLDSVCLAVFIGQLNEASTRALWSNLSVSVLSLKSLQCWSKSNTVQLMETHGLENVAPVGTAVTVKNSHITATTDGVSASAILFYVTGVTTNLTMSFIQSSVYAEAAQSSTLFYTTSKGTLRCPKLLNIEQSNITFKSRTKEAYLITVAGKVENDVVLPISDSNINLLGGTSAYILRHYVGSGPPTGQISFSVTLVNCKNVLIESLGSTSDSGIAFVYADPYVSAVHVLVLGSIVKMPSGQACWPIVLQKQDGSDSYNVISSTSTMRFENSYFELDGAQSIFITGNPSKSSLRNIAATFNNCTVNFYRRLSTIVNLASLVFCIKTFNVNVQVHHSHLNVFNEYYRGASLVYLQNSNSFTPAKHVVNMTTSTIHFNISRSIGTASTNIVAIIYVSGARGPVQIFARDLVVDVSIGVTALSNSLIGYYACSPNCDAFVSNMDLTIRKVQNSNTFSLVDAGSSVTFGTLTAPRIDLRDIKVDIIEAAAFNAVTIHGYINDDMSIVISNFSGHAAKQSGLYLVVQLTTATINRMVMHVADVALSGAGWNTVGHFQRLPSSLSSSNRPIVDSVFTMKGVVFQSAVSTSYIRLWHVGYQRVLQNTTLEITDAVVDFQSFNGIFLLQLEGDFKGGSTLSLSDVDATSLASSYVYVTYVLFSTFSGGSSLRVSNINASNIETTNTLRALMMNSVKLLSGSEFHAESINVAATAVNSIWFVYFASFQVDGTSSVTVAGGDVSLAAQRELVFAVLDGVTVHPQATFTVSGFSIDAISSTGVLYMFHAGRSSIGRLEVVNMTSSRLHAATQFILYQCAPSAGTQLPSAISFRNVSLPNVSLGHFGGTSTSSVATTNTLKNRILSIVSFTSFENAHVVLDNIEFNATITDVIHGPYYALFQWTGTAASSASITVKNSDIDVSSTNTSVVLTRLLSGGSSEDLRVSFEDSNVSLKSELRGLALVETFASNSRNTSFSFRGVVVKCVSGGSNIFLILTANGLNVTQPPLIASRSVLPLISMHDMQLETYFLNDAQRSLSVQQLGTDGSGNVSPRSTRATLITYDPKTTDTLVERHHTVVEFTRLSWSVRPSVGMSLPDTCSLNAGLSKNIHLLFDNVEMDCSQQSPTLQLVEVGNVLNGEEPQPPPVPSSEGTEPLSNITIIKSNIHIRVGNETLQENTTIDNNVSPLIRYEIGIPAVVIIVETVMSISQRAGFLPSSTVESSVLWGWSNSNDTSSSSSNSTVASVAPYPQVIMDRSSFNNVHQAVLPPQTYTGELLSSTSSTLQSNIDLKVNCTWINGKRLTTSYFTPILPPSAFNYWPSSFMDQVYVICPLSATPSVSIASTVSPTRSGGTPTTSFSPSISASESESRSSSLSPSHSQTPSGGSVTTSVTETTPLTETVTVPVTETHTISESATLTSTLSTSSTISGGTVTASFPASQSASTTLIDALPRCHYAHIQIIAVKEGSEEDKVVEVSREYEQDSTYRNISNPEVSLETLQDGVVLAYMYLTNDTTASWASLAVEPGRIRIACSASATHECEPSLEDAQRTSPLVAEMVSPFLLRLRLGPWGALYLDSTQTLDVFIDEAAVGCSALRPAEYTHELSVEVTVQAEAELQAGATNTIVALSAVGAAASPAMLMDAQSLATFSLISCSSTRDRYAMQQAMFLLSPFSLGPAPEGYVWTNLMLLTSTFALCLVAIGVMFLLKRGNKLAGACVTARFPSFYFSVAMIFHQGTAVLSMRMLLDGRWSAPAVLGTIWAIALPVLIFVTFKRKVAQDVFAMNDDSLVFFKFDDELSENWPDNIAVRFFKRFILPAGRWGPSDVRRRFGGPINWVLPTWTLYATLPLVQAVLVSFVASIHAGSMTGCMAQYGVLTLFFVSFGVAVSYLQPYRCGVYNAFQAGSYFLLAGILASSAALAYNGRQAAARSTLSVMIIAQMILVIFRTLFLLPLKFAETFIWKQYAMTTQFNALRDDRKNRTLFFRAFGRDEDLINSARDRRDNWRKGIVSEDDENSSFIMNQANIPDSCLISMLASDTTSNPRKSTRAAKKGKASQRSQTFSGTTSSLGNTTTGLSQSTILSREEPLLSLQEMEEFDLAFLEAIVPPVTNKVSNGTASPRSSRAHDDATQQTGSHSKKKKRHHAYTSGVLQFSQLEEMKLV